MAAGMGDLKLAEAQDYAKAHRLILKSCSDEFDQNKDNCSGFVKAVAAKLGISVGTTGKGRANDIYEELGRGPWIPLGRGSVGAVKAAYSALQGNFVLAAWKDPGGTGHVAVVTDLTNLRGQAVVSDRNVLAAWGVLDHAELAENGGSIRNSFNPKLKLPDVIFAAQFIKKFS